MVSKWKECAIERFDSEIFTLFHGATPQLVARADGRVNTMTIGWGTLGTLWEKPVCTVYVRPQRYTFEFMERSDLFTVCAFDEEERGRLSVCGSKSGRDVDKVEACALRVNDTPEGAPYFEQARLVIVCRKLYADDLRAEKFVDKSADEKFYPGHDYHRVYIGEVLRILRREG